MTKKKNNNVLCYRSVPGSWKRLGVPVKKKKKKKKKREMDWQLVASYFTVKSTDIFYSVWNHLSLDTVDSDMFKTLLFANQNLY